MIDEEWFTVEEIAARLKVTPRTVRAWLKDGRLCGHNFSGRTGWRVRQRDVEAFLEGLDVKIAA